MQKSATSRRFDPERLKAARRLLGRGAYTRMAVVSGVSEQTVRNWAQGKSEPDATQLHAIADLTGKPLDFFFRNAA